MKEKVDFLPLGSVVIIRGGVKKFGGADNNAGIVHCNQIWVSYIEL